MAHLRRTPALAFVVLALLLAPAFWLVHLVAADTLAGWTVEDGVIEYLQALLYLAGAVAFAVVAWRCRSRSPWAGPIALGMFVVAGEEISWGQRIFGISTPASFEESNVQGELNLHNLESVHGSVRAAGLMLIIVLFVALPLLHRAVPAVRRLVDALRVPLVPLGAVPLALVALAYMAVPRVLDGVVFELDEVGELYLALAAAAYGIGVLLLTPTDRGASDPVVDGAAAPTPSP